MAERRATDLEQELTADKCDPDCVAGAEGGPVREAGGTTGANNLSPGGASRTGGATSGVGDAEAAGARELTPDA